MFTKKCKCEKFDPKIVDGYQFCLDCGKAHLVPVPEVPERQIGGHKLVHLYESQVQNSFNSIHVKLLQRCEKCGMYFTFNNTTGRYEDKRPDETFCI
jgi:hypothetical protein